MTYQEALDYIWGLVNFETTPPESREPYTLERMEALMGALGNPERTLTAVHIAGTKGKGSTSAMLESVLRAAGYRTGLYTSPHLHDPRERIQVGGKPLSEEQFIALIDRMREAATTFPGITTFEALTAMAFQAFREMGVEIAVVEVGLGGRLDATNLLTPLLSVITPLALEHTVVLGNTIEEIASEKGGIIKPRVPVVISKQQDSAIAVLRRIASERSAPLVVAQDRWQATRASATLDGQWFDLHEKSEEGVGKDYAGLFLPLLGAHQISNAIVAVTALEGLRARGIQWKEEALREGLATVRWPARVEVLLRAPVVIADGAHTRESAAALADTIRESMPGGWERATLVLGLLRDKDPAALLESLRPLADRLILTSARHPRAVPAEQIAAHPVVARMAPQIVPDVATAVRQAIATSSAGDIVVATGSLFVAAEARQALLEETGHGKSGREEASQNR